MERLRMRFMAEDRVLHPLGGPKSGRVIESLGKTDFRKSNNAIPSSSMPDSSLILSGLNDDDDDLDLLSSRNTSPAKQHRHMVKPAILKSSTKTKREPEEECLTKFAKVKHRTTCRSTQKSNISSRMGSDMVMPPSNQLALKIPKQSSNKEKMILSPLLEISPNRDKKGKGKMTVEPAPFPMDFSPSHVKHKRNDIKKSSGRKPAPFPDISPISAKRSPLKKKAILKKTSVRRPQAFPMDIGPAKASPCRKFIKGIVSDEEDEEDELAFSKKDVILTYGAPRPFPMALDIPSQSTQESQGSNCSSDDSKDDKAIKRSPPSPKLDDLFDTSILIGTDPSSLCPYCDEPWPSAPSSTLTSLLERARYKSYKDPRPGNVLGLTAPLTVFVEVCQRHRFEISHLPLAIERGWPTKLNFAGLPKRILSFRKILSEIVHNPTLNCFWRDLRDDMQEVGKTKIASVTGQFATFERALPGYYGEQGSFIIHQTLYSAFPTDTIPPSAVHPLSVDQFVTHVLVPETALLLIKEDMCLDTREDAIQIMQESKQYGVIMFPEQAQSDDVTRVGERLAWERAKKQRKVLEARGETDADVRRQVEQEEREAKRMKPKEVRRIDDRPSSEAHHKSERDDNRGTRAGEWETRTSTETMITDDSTSRSTSKKPKPKWRKIVKPRSKQTESREASTTSWREKLSSPSLGVDPKPKCILPSQDNLLGTKWNFNLRTDPDSSDREDIGSHALMKEGTCTTDEASDVTYAIDSDSDVIMLADESTPNGKPSSNHHVKTPSNRFEKRGGAIATQDKRRGTGDIVMNLEAKAKPTVTKSKDICEKPCSRPPGASTSSKPTLGQTKRRKKEATTGGKLEKEMDKHHNWLFSDSDSN